MRVTINTLLFVIGLACAQGATFDLGERGRLDVKVHEKWDARGRDLLGKGFDLTLQPKGDANAQCKLTLIYLPRKTPLDKEATKKEVRTVCQKFVSGSVEKRIDLKELSPKRGYGAYSSFTDASLVGKPPIKANYKTMTSGILWLADDVTAATTILCDDFKSDEFKAMLAMVESLEINRNDSKTDR